jgi:hypothetical protein
MTHYMEFRTRSLSNFPHKVFLVIIYAPWYVIDKMNGRGGQTMSYMINAEMLGDVATEADAERMVEILSELGYDVAIGVDRSNDPNYIPENVWSDALEQIGRE